MAWQSIFNRRWRRVSVIAGLVLLSLLLGLRVFVMTPMAHSIAESRIEALSVRGQSIAIDRVHGDLLFGIRADRIRVSDDEGFWLDVDEARVSWRLIPLLFGRLDLKEIQAETLSVARRPNLAPASTSGQAAPFEAYRVGQLSIATLSLAEDVAGPAQTYQLAGNLEAAGWKGDLHLDLIPTEGRGDELQADITWGGDALLEGEIDLTGVPDGLVAQILGLRAGEAVTARLNASGGLLGGEVLAQAQIGSDTVINVEAKADRRDYKASGRIALSRFARLESIAQRLGDELEFEANIDADQRVTASVMAAAGAMEISGDLVSNEIERSLEDAVIIATRLDAPSLSGRAALEVSDLTASGRFFQSDGRIGFDGRLEAPSLTYDSYSLGDVSSDGLIDFTSGTLSVDSKLGMMVRDGFPPSVKTALGGSIIAGVVAGYSIPRSLLSVESASLRGEKLSLAGSGAVKANGPVAVTGSFGVEELSIMRTVSGNFSLNGESVSDIEIAMNGRASPAETAPQLFQELAPSLSYEVRATRADDAVALNQAELRSDAISAVMTGRLEANQVSLTGRTEARLGDQIEGLEGPLQSQFSVSGAVAEPVILVGVNGTFLGDPIQSELTGQVQGGRFIASAFDGEWRQLMASGRGAIEFASLPDSSFNLRIEGEVPNLSDLKAEILYEGRELASQVSVNGYETGNTRVETADLQLAGTWPEFVGTATYAADLPILGAPHSVTGSHPLTLNTATRSVVLEGDVRIGDEVISIQSPLKISANPALAMTGVFAGFGGEIDLDFDNSGTQPSRLTLTDIALSDLGSVLQRPGLIGTLDGEANVQLSELGPNGAASFQIADLSRAGLTTGRANVKADAQLINGELVAQAFVMPSEGDVSLQASLNTTLVDAGSVLSVRQSPSALTPISLAGSGDLAPLWALAGLDLRLGGQFTLDISNGDGQTFRFSGPASLTNGVFEDGITGIFLEELQAQLKLDPEAITVEQAFARGAGGGEITASGTYSFNGDSDLEANLSRLRALRREDVSTTLSGQASIERRDQRTHVEGDFRIDEMRVDLSKLPRAGYTTLDVQFDNTSELETDQAPTREAISLDLLVRADRRIFVDGPSFESEWGVDAKISGSPGAPNLTGAATLVRGEANVIGQRFDLSQGLIRFAGAPTESELNLRADRTSDGVTTMITLNGEVANPEITLGSDPNLPEDEVLARVLFGRSPSNLSPLQAAQLASAAAQLAGGDAFSLTGELQDATGLDRLDFGVDDDGQATLSTGKYLADDVYLEIESGATGAPAVTIEWTPLQNVEVDAEVDPELGPKVAIQWKRDFDRLPGESRDE